MYEHTNRWVEHRWEREYVGCCGYDDPVYESVRRAYNRSETVIMFDDGDERRAFHSFVVSLKSDASKGLQLLRDEVLAAERATLDKAYVAALQGYIAKQEERIKALDKKRSTFWLWSWLVYVPEVPEEPAEPSEENIKREANIALLENNLAHTFDYILSMPSEYELFTSKVLKHQYHAVMEFKQKEAA